MSPEEEKLLKAARIAREQGNEAAARLAAQKILELRQQKPGALPDAPTDYEAKSLGEIRETLVKDLQKPATTFYTGLSRVGEELRAGEFETSPAGIQKTPIGQATQAAQLALTEGVLPAMGQTIGPLAKAATQAVLPEKAERFFVETGQDFSKGVGSYFENNPWAARALEIAKESYSGFIDFMEQNTTEQQRRELGSLVDLSVWAAPPTKVSPLVSPTLSSVAGDLMTSAKKGRSVNIKPQVQEMLEPIKLEKGPGGTTVIGPFDKKTYVPTPFEEDAVDLVSKLPGINPRRSEGYNLILVDNEIEKQAKILMSRIAKKGNPQYDKDLLILELEEGLKTLLNQKGTAFDLASGSRGAAQRYYRAAIRAINENDSDLLGLLQARKDYDSVVNEARVGINDPSYKGRLTAEREINKILRTLINSRIAEGVPDVEVNELLRKQSLLYGAGRTLKEKFDAQATSIEHRLRANLKRVLGLSMPATPLALGATGLYLTNALQNYWHYLAAAASVGGIAYTTKKALTAPATKEALALLISQANKAIKKTENSAMIEQIKADRLYMIGLLNDANAAPKENNKER